MTVNAREFRNALGQFATGVAIVTAEVEGEKLGSTISSFNSVSLDPPLVLFSLARNSLGFERWKKAQSYCVAVLKQGQQDLSNRFAKAGTDKWEGVTAEYANNGVPTVADALAYFECEPYHVCPGGDHEVFICRVTDFKVTEPDGDALVFFSGRYRQLQAPVTTAEA